MEYTNQPIPKIKAVRKAAPVKARVDLRVCKPTNRPRKLSTDAKIENLAGRLDHLEAVVNTLLKP